MSLQPQTALGPYTIVAPRDASVFACGCARHVADLFVAHGLA